MAKYLDSAGVTSLISAIKNDGAKKITLGGYTKATASATLATTDTLNDALGKLEKNIEIWYNSFMGQTLKFDAERQEM